MTEQRAAGRTARLRRDLHGAANHVLMRPTAWTWTSPAARVWGWTAFVAALALGVWWVGVRDLSTVVAVPIPIPWPLIALGVYLAEVRVVQVHFRRESHSFSLSEIPSVVGLFLLAWTIFTVIMTIAAVRVSGAVLAVFVVLTLTFAFLTIGEFASNASMAKVGGWLGLVTAALAWYTAMAGVTAATYKRSVFPTWPAS